MSRKRTDLDTALRRDKAVKEPYRPSMLEEKKSLAEEHKKIQQRKTTKALGDRLKPALVKIIETSNKKQSVKSFALELVQAADIQICRKGQNRAGFIDCSFEFAARVIRPTRNLPWNRTVEFLADVGTCRTWTTDDSGGCPVLKMDNIRLSVPAECFD